MKVLCKTNESKTNPTLCKEVEISKSGKLESERRFLYPVEVETLMKSAKSQGRNGCRDALMILMAYRHGLRVSELVSLKWVDIDWKSPQIFIHRAKGSNDSTQPLYKEETRLLKQQFKRVQNGSQTGLPNPVYIPL